MPIRDTYTFPGGDMKIETTINMSKRNMRKILHMAETYGYSKSHILTMLLRTCMHEQKLQCSLCKRVRYQARRTKHDWKVLHIWLPADLFEMCVDMRKFCKLSVSLLSATAIELYLETVKKKLEEDPETLQKPDNYQGDYIFIYKNDQNITNFHLFWGIPEGKPKKT
jgi:hypothetical protein